MQALFQRTYYFEENCDILYISNIHKTFNIQAGLTAWK